MITKTSHFMGHSKIRWVIWAILEGFIIGIQRSDSDYEVSMHWLIVDTLSPIDQCIDVTSFWHTFLSFNPEFPRNLGVILFDTFLLFFFYWFFMESSLGGGWESFSMEKRKDWVHLRKLLLSFSIIYFCLVASVILYW